VLIGASMGGCRCWSNGPAQTRAVPAGCLLLALRGRSTGRPRAIAPAARRTRRCGFEPALPCARFCRQAFADQKPVWGRAKQEVASLHLRTQGLGRFAATLVARSGGVGSPVAAEPLPAAALQCFGVLTNDRILRPPLKRASQWPCWAPRVMELEDAVTFLHLGSGPIQVAASCETRGELGQNAPPGLTEAAIRL